MMLEGMTAAIVGGTAGIGLAIAQGFAGRGCAHLTLLSRQAKTGEAAARQVAAAGDLRCDFHRLDALLPQAAVQSFNALRQSMGRIDILVHCVGGYVSPQPFETKPLASIDSAIDSHLRSALYVVHAALPIMIAQGGGSIVLLSSDAAKSATPGESVIGAAKAGVAMFCRTVALEVARHRIRVNCITPSIVRGTATYDRLIADEFSRKLFQKAEERAKLGVVIPEDIAPLAAFLGSPQAGKITGQIISINGGISAA